MCFSKARASVATATLPRQKRRSSRFHRLATSPSKICFSRNHPSEAIPSPPSIREKKKTKKKNRSMPWRTSGYLPQQKGKPPPQRPIAARNSNREAIRYPILAEKHKIRRGNHHHHQRRRESPLRFTATSRKKPFLWAMCGSTVTFRPATTMTRTTMKTTRVMILTACCKRPFWRWKVLCTVFHRHRIRRRLRAAKSRFWRRPRCYRASTIAAATTTTTTTRTTIRMMTNRRFICRVIPLPPAAFLLTTTRTMMRIHPLARHEQDYA
mmetsp:Transcript_8147/g.17264  ORF Transcript_8147/g.17264 Transcript_8147/m.17264 type:complete len:267 (-) Transcript_8147:49-849(-)